jgi:DNA-binding response OmpR family regulator
MHEKILIADDEAGIRRLLRGYLEKAGFKKRAWSDSGPKNRTC